MKRRPSILLIYTGGTIGMIRDHRKKTLIPMNFTQIKTEVPELYKFDIDLRTISFDPPLDSSEAGPDSWIDITGIIKDNYNDYDGFVVLHGTDTMAWSASAVSFLLENLAKAVIFTGSQLPVGTLRTDGKENLISAIEIAAAKINGKAAVPEVGIFFENRLYRGNRTTKYSAEHFSAFRSANFPPLAEAGIDIEYNSDVIRYPKKGTGLKTYEKLDSRVAVLKIFPGLNKETFNAVTGSKDLKGLIIETFGSGNAITHKWFIDGLKNLVRNDVPVLNVTQCLSGSVNMERYQTGRNLLDAGVTGGADITIESAVVKMMFLLANTSGIDEIKLKLQKSLRGEINAI